MKINGNDLIVMLRRGSEWHTVAFGTTCELDITAETITVGTNRSGRWVRHRIKRISWQVTSGQLLSDQRQDVDLFALMKAGDAVGLAFTTVASHELPMAEPPVYTPDGRFRLTGDAFVTRLTVTGRRGDYATMSATFTGDGELTPAPAPETRRFTVPDTSEYQIFTVPTETD